MMETQKMQPDYIRKIDELKDEMIKDLSDLIKIRSVKEDAEEGAPFGKGVKDAFHHMLALGEREGFSCENIDEYGGHIDYGTAVDEGVMGVLCHLDVVPEGSGWERDPYSGDVLDGVVYGRGTLDDKGPTISAFYAMKALKDCGYEPSKKIRMIIGLDEETGSSGMEEYKKKVAMPDFAIVPDSDFPLVHGEMGIMIFKLLKNFSAEGAETGGAAAEAVTAVKVESSETAAAADPAEKNSVSAGRSGEAEAAVFELKRVSGGTAANMVPDYAEAVIVSSEGDEALRAAAASFAERTGRSIDIKAEGNIIRVSCEGVSSHGAHPEKGVNAVSILMDFLGMFTFSSSEINSFIEFYNNHIGGDLHGERLGCEIEDEISGKLILNVGIIELDDQHVKLTVNIRCPVTGTDAEVYSLMAPVLEKYGITVGDDAIYEKPVYYSLDNPVVQTLLDIYRKHTGDYESQPLVIGGGTYAREMDNAIAFGALYPGDPDTMHQKNECVSVDRVVQTAKIYAEAMYELAVK